MESSLLLLLLFLGIGESYIFDLIVFFLIVQALEALSQHSEKEEASFMSFEGLVKLFLWYLQATGMLIPEDFWPKISKELIGALNFVNFHASSIFCIPFIRAMANHIGLEVTKLLINIAVPLLLCCFMVPIIFFRRWIEANKGKYGKALHLKCLTRQCCDGSDSTVLIPDNDSDSQYTTSLNGPDTLIMNDDNTNSNDLKLGSNEHESMPIQILDSSKTEHGHYKPTVTIEVASMVLFIAYATLTEIARQCLKPLAVQLIHTRVTNS
jgi:hypothetical protein